MKWPFRRRGPAGSASGERRGWGISLSTRLAGTVLGVGLASLVAATVVGVNAGQSLGRDIVEDSLQAQRTSGALETTAQLRYFERLVAQLATSSQTAVAIEQFSAALPELADLPPEELRDLRDQLLA